MYCARDLIRFELKRTKTLQPVPPEDQVHIACPHCLVSTAILEHNQLFQDIDKEAPVKYYTDDCSPRVAVLLGDEEMKITVAHVVKHDTPEGRKVAGVVI